MADHEGKVKEIHWDAAGPELRIFDPENVPDYLKTDAGDSSAACSPCPPCLLAALIAAALTVLAITIYSQFFYSQPKQRDPPPNPSIENDALIVFDFPPIKGPTASPSSSVTQVEAMLRFAGVSYGKCVGLPGPDVAPLAGRCGYLSLGLRHSSLTVADPYAAIRFLVDSGVVPAALELPQLPAHHAAALAVQRLCETDLPAALAHFRWVDDANWAANKADFGAGFGMLQPMRALMLRQARISMKKRVAAQPMAHRSPAAIIALVKAELGAIDALLEASGGPFLFGGAPCAADAAAFGVLDQLIFAGELSPQLAAAAVELPRLRGFVEHLRKEYFGEGYEASVWGGKGEERSIAASNSGSERKKKSKAQ